MNILTLENLSKSWQNRTLLESVAFSMDSADKVGLIGVNGSGKSTLLSIIAGIAEADSGSYICRKGLRISYLPQNPDFDPDMSLLQNVAARISGKEGHWDTEGEARVMLRRFGIEDADMNPALLSGGQKKRAALAAAILTPSDLLILDEPTNHLDSVMIEWLQEYLRKYAGAILLVTHDRYFLDQVTNKIIEVDRGKLYQYESNYSGYLELKQQRLDYDLAAERKLAALYKKDLAWIQRGARARSTKQKAHIMRFEALRDREQIVLERQVEMASAASRLGSKTIECREIGKSFEGKRLFENFTYIFLKNDRIGIIGPNGCGKSTLLKIITGRLAPDTGSIETGQTVKIGYFGQEYDSFISTGRVIDAVRDRAEFVQVGNETISAARMCERFLFDGNMQYTPIEKLSGGEKRRLYLLQILMEAPNVLVLDEPTNDLDIATLRVLEDYLDSFAGIVITVSHDRYFLDRVVTRIFSFEPDGSIRQSEGGYTEYYERQWDSAKASLAAGISKACSKAARGHSDAGSSFPRQRIKKKLSYTEQREYDNIENEIDMLQAHSNALAAKMDACATDYVKLKELGEEKERTDREIDEKMARFLELEELVASFREAAEKNP